jgi:PHD/YefM family antitoxin component YafN of YafNO toxin-antitoxin module
MTYKGSLINDRYVLFGAPLNDKVKKVINNGCPTGDDIIKSLPKSAFIPVADEVTVVKEEPKIEIKKRKDRIKRKKELAKQKKKEELKKQVEVKKEPITINKIIEEKTMSLDQELDSLMEEAKPKQPEVIEEPQPEVVTQEDSADTMRSQILGFLAKDPNTPSLDTIDAWKEQFGQNGIHVMSFGDMDNYIYHHLTRGEWKKIKEAMKRLRDSENADELEEKLKETVVRNCILWPEPNSEWLENSKAGVVDSLYQMILLNSGFLTPQQAMLLTTQL